MSARENSQTGGNVRLEKFPNGRKCPPGNRLGGQRHNTHILSLSLSLSESYINACQLQILFFPSLSFSHSLSTQLVHHHRPWRPLHSSTSCRLQTILYLASVVPSSSSSSSSLISLTSENCSSFIYLYWPDLSLLLSLLLYLFTSYKLFLFDLSPLTRSFARDGFAWFLFLQIFACC